MVGALILLGATMIDRGAVITVIVDNWLDDPEAWFGVHKLITATPLSVFLLLIGVAVVIDRKKTCPQARTRLITPVPAIPGVFNSLV